MDRAETPIRILREAPYAELVPEPEFHVSQNVPTEVGIGSLLDEIVNSIGDRRNVPLGYRCQSGLISLGKLNKNISKIAGQAIPYSGLPSPNAEKLTPHWDLVKTGNRSYAVS